MKNIYSFLIGVLLALSHLHPASASEKSRTILIILDGLRPDYISQEDMPNVYRLREEGVHFEKHHAVYPTVTRVNAASLSTGCYPAQHGVMDNTIFISEHDPEKTFSTASKENLLEIDAALSGRLVLVPTLGEVLETAGKNLLVVSSGSEGSALLLNHKVRGHGIINAGFTLPESHRSELTPLLGEAPEADAPNVGRNKYVVDAYLQYGLPQLDPEVTIFWLSDPDHTAHKYGMGSPKTVEALQLVDGEVGRIVAALEEKGHLASTNILIASDHGFSTHTASRSPLGDFRQFIQTQGVPASAFVSAGFGIYLRERAEELTPKLVDLMQRNRWIGPLFTRAASPGAIEGWVPGTLSLESIHYQNGRAPDILLSPQWTNSANVFGFKGETLIMGVAGHGSASPWDIHNTLIASGPAFQKGVRIDIPTHNVDLAPTILALQGLPINEEMDGRVIAEAFAGADAAAMPPVASEALTVRHETSTGAIYSTTLHRSTVGTSRYFDYAESSLTTE